MIECLCCSESSSCSVIKYKVIVNNEEHLACRECLFLLGLTKEQVKSVIFGLKAAFE